MVQEKTHEGKTITTGIFKEPVDGRLHLGRLNLAGDERDGIHYMLMKIGAAALGPLTDRQREIVLSVSEGLSNKEVGSRLDITPATVAAHLRVIYKKLKVDSRMMTWPTSRVASTIRVLTRFGKICRAIMRKLDAPATLARSMKS